MKNNHPILWKSEEVNANGDPFFTVRKADGYYIYGERAGVDSVAFVLHNKTDYTFGLINEPKPPLGEKEFRTTAFGGSLDKDISLPELVQEEVKEESGYIVDISNIHYLGKVLVSTQMNQYCHLFCVDVTDIPVGDKALEEHEFGSTVAWLSPQDVVEATQDWKAPLILLRYFAEAYNKE